MLSHQIGRHDGQGRVSYEIAVAALTNGCEVTLLAVRCSEDLQKHPHARFIQIECAGWPTQLLRNICFANRSTAWLKKHAGEFDIVQVNGFITWAASDVNVAHFVHGAWLKSKYYPFRSWWQSAYVAYQCMFTVLNAHWEKAAFDRSRSLVAVSRRVAEELGRSLVPAEKIFVIHNGVDTDEFHPGLQDRKHFSLPLDVPLFLFAGDIRTPRKNLETVLRAVARNPAIHLAIAGSLKGSPYPSLARQLNIAGRTYFLDMVNEMPLLMRSVDAFIFPSRYDPLGLVILEAMASGLPVITSRKAGGAELLGAAGLILEDPDDVDTLSSWLARLSADKELRLKMGIEAREAALSNTWEIMANHYLELYETLASTHAGSHQPATTQEQFISMR